MNNELEFVNGPAVYIVTALIDNAPGAGQEGIAFGTGREVIVRKGDSCGNIFHYPAS